MYTPAIYTKKEPVSRFPSHWILDYYERGATQDELENASISIPEIKLMGDLVSEDFNRNPPDFIMLYKDDFHAYNLLFSNKEGRSMRSFLRDHESFNQVLSQYRKVDEYILSFYGDEVIMVYDVLRREKN